MIAQRLKEAVAIVVIGDGVVAAISPRRHSRLWQGGPGWYKQFMQMFIDRPGMTRISGVAQVVLGLSLASRQWPR